MTMNIRREAILIRFGYNNLAKGAHVENVTDIYQGDVPVRTIAESVRPVTLADLQGLIEGEAADWVVALSNADFIAREADEKVRIATEAREKAEAERAGVLRTIDTISSLLTQKANQVAELEAALAAAQA